MHGLGPSFSTLRYRTLRNAHKCSPKKRKEKRKEKKRKGKERKKITFIVIPLVLSKKQEINVPYHRMNKLRYVHSMKLSYSKKNEQTKITHKTWRNLTNNIE